VDGTITSWAVRGARGTLALQVLRRQGNGLVQVDRSADERVPGPGVHVARTALPVAAGDRVALIVPPGAAVGVRGDGPRAATERWFGPLLEPARPPERPAGTGLDRELLLRVDIRPGPRGADETVRGTAAARAPAGDPVAFRAVDVGRGESRTVFVVTVGGGVALDLFDGNSRLARAPLRGAQVRGRVDALIGGDASVRVRWRNPDGTVVRRSYAVTAGGLRPTGPSG
jgi:hypothetical protein